MNPQMSTRSRQAEATITSLEAVMATAALGDLTDIARRAQLTAEQASRETLTVAVVGQFKAGKSSLLNSLMGMPLLPIRAVPATSVITVATYGAQPGAVMTRLSGTERSIDMDELKLYVTEQHNPHNCREVAQVRLTTPSLASYPDLELVDTPGLGSVFGTASALSASWLPNIGAALVTVNATQPLSAADVALIQQLKAYTPDIAVVLTKADLLADEELGEVRAFVHDHVCSTTGMEVPVLTHSAVSSDPAMTSEVRSHLRTLQERHSEAIGSLARHRTSQLIGECREYLHLALAASEADVIAVDRLKASLSTEHTYLRTAFAEAERVVDPIKRALETTLSRRLTQQAPQVEVLARHHLVDEMAGWHGSLAHETRMFERWIARTLTDALEPLSGDALKAATPFLHQARDSLARLGQAFVQRLSSDVERALGISFHPAPISAALPAMHPVSVAVSPVFDSRLDTLSWALPMPLIRPLVHSHFMSFLAWHVEKNCLRLGYQTAGEVGEAIDAMVDECLAAMAERVTSCQRMLTQHPDDGDKIRALLDQLGDAEDEGPTATWLQGMPARSLSSSLASCRVASRRY